MEATGTTTTREIVVGVCRAAREAAARRGRGPAVGEVEKMWRRPSGLWVGRMRIPLGVIGIIYESRPNVTADAAALCVKSGNAVILRGGSEAIFSNTAIARILREAMTLAGLPADAAAVIHRTDPGEVDWMIPGGG